jgi:GT2 family glycosyltransferase
VCGASLKQWQTHLWLQRLPIAAFAGASLNQFEHTDHQLRLPVSQGDGRRVALNLEWPPPERLVHWQEHLRAQRQIWDPDPARVEQLCLLGLPAVWLDPGGAGNGWLEQPSALDSERWAAGLGLAPPDEDAAIVLGSAGADWDRALTAEAAEPTPGSPSISYVPGWHELICTSAEQALAQAGWLALAAERAAALVWMQPELEQALCTLREQPAAQLVLQAPITPAELRAQLAGEPLRVLAEDRPTPPLQELYRWEGSGVEPHAAVLVSLHNYADRITAALDSVAAQRQQQLELIVVDDASTDNGAAVVRAWMETQARTAGSVLARLLLVRHQHNAGLATARNTAFAAAQSPWCFVLDADNALYPEAVRVCLALATAASAQLAVVHPLLAVEVEPGRPDDQRTLVSTAAWQRQRLLGGNVVDAMALVRREAWQAVGGYTHIEGGWEDFDFWCKLIEAGYHGMQCPRVLAVYRSHASSMSHTATNRHWRALSRTLQQRHPWLELPLAR